MDGLRAAVESAPHAVVALDAGGFVRYLSRPLADWPPDEVMGGAFLERVAEEGRELAAAAVRNAVTPGLVHTLDVPVAARGGGVRWFQASVSPMRADGAVVGVLILAADVTARRREEERLRRSERLMVDAQGVAHLGTWEWDLKEPHASWSDELYRIYGLEPGTHVPTYQDYLTRVHPEDRQRVIDATEAVLHDHRPYSHDERIYHDTGEMRYLHTWAEPVLDDADNLVKLVGVCQDITDRKLVEERLRESLAEKEVLLKEVHHRVKNNLQVIASLLSLQAANVPDAPSRAAFEESRNRVRSMALVHETLYRANEFAVIDFGAYARRLSADLFRAYAVDPNAVRVEVAADEVELGIDAAINCGLLLNELVSNALKHAFPDGRRGRVLVSLRQAGDDAVTLAVEDDGVGVPEGFDPRGSGSLGLPLVATLADQLGARFEIDRAHGTAVRVTFDPAKGGRKR